MGNGANQIKSPYRFGADFPSDPMLIAKEARGLKRDLSERQKEFARLKRRMRKLNREMHKMRWRLDGLMRLGVEVRWENGKLLKVGGRNRHVAGANPMDY